MNNALALDYSGVEAVRALTVRKAAMQDISSLLRLINGYAEKGVMLPRTEFDLSQNIRDFTLILSGETVVGCGALHFYTPTSAEIRSLAVDSSATRRGIGRAIVEALEKEARECRLHSIFAFTYVTDFFRRLGFVEVERGEFPLKMWRDCLRCSNFSCCPETSVVKYFANTPHPPLQESRLIMPMLKQ